MLTPRSISLIAALGLHLVSVAHPFEVAEPKLVMEIQERGRIVIELNTRQAPKTCAQIIALTERGFYDAQRFFKVIREPRPFLVQLGDPQSKTGPLDNKLGNGGSGKKLAFEKSDLPHVKGAVGLARLPEDPNSGDSQFYIMLDTASYLDGRYTVFGNVTQGLDVLDKVRLGDRITSIRVQK